MILCRSLRTERYGTHFNECDGWECRRVPSPCVRDITCVLSREVPGRKEAMALAVSYDEDPSMLALEAVAASLTRKILNGQYLIVPKAANVSAIPKAVHIISMESFGFVDGRLVWLARKKNAKRYPQTEEAVEMSLFLRPAKLTWHEKGKSPQKRSLPDNFPFRYF